MNPTFKFIVRTLFAVLALTFIALFGALFDPRQADSMTLLEGAAIVLAFSGCAILIERLLRRSSLRAFFIVSLGLFFGTLGGEAIFSLLANLPFEKETLLLLRGALLLFTGYLGVMITARGADEIAVSLPFIQFQSAGQKKKDLLLDISILTDPRILDLAASGIVDGHLIMPRFLIKELQTTESEPKARKCLETLKKLEQMPGLDLRVVEQDYLDLPDTFAKLLKLARILDASLLTADIDRIRQAQIEGIRIINIHLLANALKPISQSGEQLDIKVQRYGKEPRQGIGYLEDGTMVVVNGGASHLGQTIRCQVLSVKHTASGRLIFCNAPELAGEEGSPPNCGSYESAEHTPSQYFVQDYERNRV